MTPRLAAVRFYVDQDLRGLGKILGDVRPDVTYPGDPGGLTRNKRRRPPSPIDVGALDEDWIPVVASRGWVIISRDKRIHERFSQLSLIRDHDAKMVCLTGEAGRDKWSQLEAFMTNWRAIEAVADETPPFVYRASRTSLNALDIDEALGKLRRGRGRGT